MRSPVQIWLAAPENRRFHNENGGFSNILLQLKSSSKVVGAILVTGAIFSFSGLFCKHIFQSIGGFFVRLLEGVNIEVADPACAAFCAGVGDDGLIHDLALVADFVAQPLPSGPGVGFLCDSCGLLGGVAGFSLAHAILSATEKEAAPLR